MQDIIIDFISTYNLKVMNCSSKESSPSIFGPVDFSEQTMESKTVAWGKQQNN